MNKENYCKYIRDEILKHAYEINPYGGVSILLSYILVLENMDSIRDITNNIIFFTQLLNENNVCNLEFLNYVTKIAKDAFKIWRI